MSDPHSVPAGPPLSHSVAHVSTGGLVNEQVTSLPLPSQCDLMTTIPVSHYPPGVHNPQGQSQFAIHANGQGLPTPMASPIGSGIGVTSLPGTRLSGRLVGVISQTDILNLYARVSGLSPIDPAETRSRRRRSSSISLRKSGDIGRDLGLR